MAADALKAAWALSASSAAAAMQVSCGVELLINAAATNQVDLLTFAVELQNLPVDVMLQWTAPGRFPRRRTLCAVAAATGSFDAVHYLLTKGADPNGKSPDDGYTPLHCAAESGHARTAEVIALLLSFGGLRDVLDAAGRRPVDLLAELIETQKGVLLSGHGEVGADVPGLCTGPSELDKEEFQTDDFRMYGFKVAKCCKSRAHDWTECPFAHPAEKARRRDPTQFTYSGSACPDFRKGTCKRGDSCQFAHGVFECWLHPARYRTQLCKDAPMCTRRVCFFAHSLEELRQPPEQQSGGSADGSTTTTSASAPSSRTTTPDPRATPSASSLTSATSLSSTTSVSPIPGSAAHTPTPTPSAKLPALASCDSLTTTPSHVATPGPIAGTSPALRSPLAASLLTSPHHARLHPHPQPQVSTAPLLSPLALATALQQMSCLSLHSGTPQLDATLLNQLAFSAQLAPVSAAAPLHPTPLAAPPLASPTDAAALVHHLQLLAGQGGLASAGAATTGAHPAIAAPQGGFGALRSASYEALDRWISMLTADSSGDFGGPAAATMAAPVGFDGGAWQPAPAGTDYQVLLQQQQQQQGCPPVAAR